MTEHPVDTWHRLVRSQDPSGLGTLLAEDAVFHSPVVHTPQRGRALAAGYLGAAFQVFFNPTFRYVREVRGDRDAVLEFETEIDGMRVNGVDLIRWNAAGQIVDFKVMIRPLKAIECHSISGMAAALPIRPAGALTFSRTLVVATHDEPGAAELGLASASAGSRRRGPAPRQAGGSTFCAGSEAAQFVAELRARNSAAGQQPWRASPATTAPGASASPARHPRQSALKSASPAHSCRVGTELERNPRQADAEPARSTTLSSMPAMCRRRNWPMAAESSAVIVLRSAIHAPDEPAAACKAEDRDAAQRQGKDRSAGKGQTQRTDRPVRP